ncbi:MAG: 3-dehydroquinate synthase [Thermoleophilia bacterium]|nr:3-dehydroquinate synthase [Thermoleophilia bacterium]
MASGHVLEARIGVSEFPVFIGPGLIGRMGELWTPRADGGAALVVHDEAVSGIADRVAEGLREAGQRVETVPVASGESSKSLSEVERLTRVAARARIRRRDAVVAIGGGVLGDLAGFLAASYQRGIGLVHVPTTLLAMVDSAIGGKTGVDLPEGKNYVGAIWQPRLVVMDTETLESLPQRQLSCGFAEVVKYGLLESPELFERIDAWPDPLPGPREELIDLIRDCVLHKLRVVSEDEFETGLRASLNLGHTVGHGIEAAGGYDRYQHGEAISLGLLAALRIAERMTGLDPVWRARTRAVLARHRLPVTLDPTLSTEAILDAMGRDKKADAGALNMVLIGAPGDIRLRQNPPMEMVVQAIEELHP